MPGAAALLLPLLLFGGSAQAALHENDNWCDNGQDRYWCSEDCTAVYYCANGASRGANYACPGNTFCNSHGPHATTALEQAGPLSQDWAGSVTCPASTNTGCWSKSTSVDACATVTCSGHGRCVAGTCFCSTGYTGASCSGGGNADDSECPGKLDIMLVLDNSGSIDAADKEKVRSFARGLMSPFVISDQYTKIGVVYFESFAYLRVGLTGDATAIATAIDLEDQSGGTDIDAGMRKAKQELDANGRAGVPKLVVLVTDGSGGDPTTVVSQLKGAGVHITTVGFGTGIVSSDLTDWASYRANSTTVKDYHEAPSADKLGDIFAAFGKETCIIVQPEPPPPILPPPPPVPSFESATADPLCATGTPRPGSWEGPWPPVIMTVRGKELTTAVTKFGGNAFKCKFEPDSKALADATTGQPGVLRGEVVVQGKWDPSDSTESFTCEVPEFLNKSWATPLRLKAQDIRDQTWHAKVSVSLEAGASWVEVKSNPAHYVVCCQRAEAGFLVLWTLIPVFLILICCTLCFIYVLTKGPIPMPDAKYAEEPRPQTVPPLQLRESIKITEVRRMVAPKAPPEPVKKEKKKWETVATGQYFRDGAHLETKWGKFGEAGGMHVEGEEDDKMEEEDDDKFEEVEELTEKIQIPVQSPERLSKNLRHLDIERGDDDFVADRRSKPCAWFTDYWKLWLLFLLACLGLIGLVVLCIILTGDYTNNYESQIKLCH